MSTFIFEKEYCVICNKHKGGKFSQCSKCKFDLCTECIVEKADGFCCIDCDGKPEYGTYKRDCERCKRKDTAVMLCVLCKLWLCEGCYGIEPVMLCHRCLFCTIANMPRDYTSSISQ